MTDYETNLQQTSSTYDLRNDDVVWNYEQDFTKQGHPNHPFLTWYERAAREQPKKTCQNLLDFMKWIETTVSAPTSDKAGDRLLKYFESPESIAFAKKAIAIIIDAYRIRQTTQFAHVEIKMLGYLLWLHVSRREDDYLMALVQYYLSSGLPSDVLWINGYLSWRDKGGEQSELSKKIIAMTDALPVFTEDPCWKTVEAIGIPTINKKLNRAHGWRIGFRLHSRDQKIRRAGDDTPQLPAIKCSLSYPHDEGAMFHYGVQSGYLIPTVPDLGLRWQQGYKGGNVQYWPPLEAHRPRVMSQEELVFRATPWPRLSSPMEIPKFVRALVEAFDLDIDLEKPLYFNKRETKLVADWLKNG